MCVIQVLWSECSTKAQCGFIHALHLDILFWSRAIIESTLCRWVMSDKILSLTIFPCAGLVGVSESPGVFWLTIPKSKNERKLRAAIQEAWMFIEGIEINPESGASVTQ